MIDSWGVRYVDQQVEQGWREFRRELADRFAEGLDAGAMGEMAISTPDGRTLTADVFDDDIVIVAGDDLYSSANVDEAAYLVWRVLTEEWQVVHPAFLDSPVTPAAPQGEADADVVPAYGRAASVDELRAWVLATFNAGREAPVTVDADGDVMWATAAGNRFWVTVRNPSMVEIVTDLGRQVGFKKARKVMDDLSKRYAGVKFLLVQDTLFMAHGLVAAPYCGEHLTDSCTSFATLTDELAWVRERVLSKRAKVDRSRLQEAEKARVDAEAALAEAEARAEAAERLATRRTAQRDWHRRNSARLRRERDAARTQQTRPTRHQEAS